MTKNLFELKYNLFVNIILFKKYEKIKLDKVIIPIILGSYRYDYNKKLKNIPILPKYEE